MSESLVGFEAYDQTAWREKLAEERQRAVVEGTKCRVPPALFVPYLERTACAKVNETYIHYAENTSRARLYRKHNVKKVSLTTLFGPAQSRPFVMARGWIWFILYSHPLSKVWATYPGIARRYNYDHSTVRHHVRKVYIERVGRPTGAYTTALRDICHNLNEHFEYFDPDRVRL